MIDEKGNVEYNADNSHKIATPAIITTFGGGIDGQQ